MGYELFDGMARRDALRNGELSVDSHANNPVEKGTDMKTKAGGSDGFTLVEVMIVVAILGLLTAIAIPNFARARTQTQKNICISHLREIDSIKQQWALENNRIESSDPPTADDLKSYFWREVWPACPAGGVYEPNGIGVAPTCSLGPSLGHVLED